MTKISLREKLITFAKGKNGWINGTEFERLAMNEGFKSSNAGRRCRELATAGTLERRMNGKSVEYRWKPISQEKNVGLGIWACVTCGGDRMTTNGNGDVRKVEKAPYFPCSGHNLRPEFTQIKRQLLTKLF